MENVLRIYVEKKPEYAIAANAVFSDIKENLQISKISGIRIFNRYDVEGIDNDIFSAATGTIFSEPQVDNIYCSLPDIKNSRIFGVEYLPGQYDQRADSCGQCIQILTQNEKPEIRTAIIYALIGDISEDDYNKIKSYIINPVESREASLELPKTLKTEFIAPDKVEKLEGFISMPNEKLDLLISELGLAMDSADIRFCRDYFRDDEHRDPTITEIRMIDTYWSDHCRHTTFLTNIDDFSIDDPIVKTVFDDYIASRNKVYAGKNKKPICLMDIATIGMKYLKQSGLIPALDESQEINACSVNVQIEVDGTPQNWLLMFKNETHNHPTEIEPFGGAATCLGGAIRDPLSGRSYVYQAMRVTGAGDPTLPISKTIEGKLPQRKIVKVAAAGYSSYGNQIGLATGLVNEIYHPGYVAKRMEIGAVIGAAPKANVVREVPVPGDVVILLGGRTGRDGCGGATGSSKSHTTESLSTCGAEVQKGNPPEERKIQRLFRNPAVTQMIKRCNDFGAGGVSVAIGELADGLMINLNAVPKKYEGLNGTELAISESQERMAVVVAACDTEKFISSASSENLEATAVAVVTETPRLVMKLDYETIVDISRDFLNSNGAEKHTTVKVEKIDTQKLNSPVVFPGNSPTEKFRSLMKDLNVCSQKGLIECFDSTIGAGTVTMPFGGKTQLSPSQHMACLFPVLNGKTSDASIMAYGFNPYLSSLSPFHGAVYAVMESVAKIIAAGGCLDRCWLTLQEYFERTNNDPLRWGKPFSALLGAFAAQKGLKVAAIGGKDSMSGTFMNIDVPPTLCSFAVSTANATKIVSNCFSKPDSNVYIVDIDYNDDMLPDFDGAREKFNYVSDLISKGKVLSAYAVSYGGIAEAVAKMCFGNGLGFSFSQNQDLKMLFRPKSGSIVIETECEINDLTLLGHVTDSPEILLNGDTVSIDELIELWKKPLENVFPTIPKTPSDTDVDTITYISKNAATTRYKALKPRVFIPVFPGTNCEYDTERKFIEAGAQCDVFVVKNIKPSYVEESINEMAMRIKKSQILMLPGGFSGGDEPDGSGKFIAAMLRNPNICSSVMELVKTRDGLILGICNGFQALIKTGLLPFGEICEMDENCPTLTFNSIGRHQSRYAYTRISSTKSPWLSRVQIGDVHAIPVSHGEGRFIANDALINGFIANGQIATQYVNPFVQPPAATMDITYNPNGSVFAIEALSSPDGRILGKMGHSERFGDNVGKNIYGYKDQKLFQSGIDYFKL